jgi:hypothetical protein
MSKTPNIVDINLLAIHQRIGEKLLQQPAMIELAHAKLEARFKAGMMYRSIYLDWWAVIEMKEDMPALVEQLCEDSEQMNRLRRHSPFTGILTEQEREAFFKDLESG